MYGPLDHPELAARFGFDLGVAAEERFSPGSCGSRFARPGSPAHGGSADHGHPAPVTLAEPGGGSELRHVAPRRLPGARCHLPTIRGSHRGCAGSRPRRLRVVRNVDARLGSGCAGELRRRDRSDAPWAGRYAFPPHRVVRALFSGTPGRGVRQRGTPEEGLALLAEALALVEAHGERFYEAELYRLRGEIALKTQAACGTAVASFQQALTVARRQQAKSWELRAATSLARLWQSARARIPKPETSWVRCTDGSRRGLIRRI